MKLLLSVFSCLTMCDFLCDAFAINLMLDLSNNCEHFDTSTNIDKQNILPLDVFSPHHNLEAAPPYCPNLPPQ